MLLSIKRFVVRYPGIKRWIARVIASIPVLDLWIRNRITVGLYTSSALQMDARHLPDEARPIHDALLTRLGIDESP